MLQVGYAYYHTHVYMFKTRYMMAIKLTELPDDVTLAARVSGTNINIFQIFGKPIIGMILLTIKKPVSQIFSC